MLGIYGINKYIDTISLHSEQIIKEFILINHNYIYILFIYLIFFSKILNDYITNILTIEDHSFDKLYNLSIIEEYKQEQLLHGNFYILSTILVAPFWEEIFFRGIFLKSMLKYGLSGTKSIFISSFLFGFSHINLWQCITAFLIGSIIGMIFYKTKSLFFLHFITFFK